MKTKTLTPTKPLKGTIPGLAAGTAIRYAIDLISHPDLAEGFGELALCRGIFRNDIAVLSDDRLTSGEFISSVVAIDFRNGCREVSVSIGGTYSVEAVNKFARLWLRFRLLSFFNKSIKL